MSEIIKKYKTTRFTPSIFFLSRLLSGITWFFFFPLKNCVSNVWPDEKLSHSSIHRGQQQQNQKKWRIIKLKQWQKEKKKKSNEWHEVICVKVASSREKLCQNDFHLSCNAVRTSTSKWILRIWWRKCNKQQKLMHTIYMERRNRNNNKKKRVKKPSE